MKRRLKIAVLILFSVVALLLLLIVFTPLEYFSNTLFWIHFGITVLLGAVVTFQWIRKPSSRALAKIWWFTLTPLVLVVFISARQDNKTHILTIPRSDKFVLHRFYTLFMIGNPRMEIAVGYNLLGNVLFWRSSNTYEKDGLGDGFDEIRKYELPDSLYNQESLFLLPEEGLIVDLYHEKIFPMRLKKQP